MTCILNQNPCYLRLLLWCNNWSCWTFLLSLKQAPAQNNYLTLPARTSKVQVSQNQSIMEAELCTQPSFSFLSQVFVLTGSFSISSPSGLSFHVASGSELKVTTAFYQTLNKRHGPWQQCAKRPTLLLICTSCHAWKKEANCCIKRNYRYLIVFMLWFWVIQLLFHLIFHSTVYTSIHCEFNCISALHN